MVKRFFEFHRVPKYEICWYNEDNFRVVFQKNAPHGIIDEKYKVIPDDYIPQKDSEESQRASLSRSRRMIRELSLCNGFEYFATLTINSKNADRFNLTECQNLLKKKLKALKRKNSEFAYLFITEKHKDGAFHFHGLIKGVDDFYTNKNGYLSHKLFDEIGFNSFSKINDYTKTCNYILKYITKDCVKNEAGSIYISSRGLKKAQKSIISPFQPVDNWGFENDFVAIKDYTVSKMSQTEILQALGIKEIHKL